MRRAAVLVVIALTFLAACGKAPTALQTSPQPSLHSRAASPSAGPTSDSSPGPTPDTSSSPTAPSPAATPPATTPAADPSAPCTSVSLDASPESPQLFGAVVALTAAAQGCGSPEYRFWLITPDPPGVGLVVQGWYAQDTFTWKTADWAGPGTYGLRVDARHPGASDNGDTTTSQDFVLNPVTTGPACTAVSIDASPPSPQQVGVTVTLTATATGCPNPEYEWWCTNQGVGVLCGSWSGTATMTFGGSPNAPVGDETYTVDARQAGDTLVEATAQLVYTWTALPTSSSPSPSPSPTPTPLCTGVTLVAMPSSPQPFTTTVTFTATAAGCPSPEYQFIATYPDGVTRTPPLWSTSNTWTYTPSAPYTAQVTVNVRNQGENTVDAIATVLYVFT
jgi:hypothetical protein